MLELLDEELCIQTHPLYLKQLGRKSIQASLIPHSIEEVR